MAKQKRKAGRTCEDCGKPISPQAKRCRACARKAWWEPRKRKGNHCIDCGKQISFRAKRCRACANKIKWDDKLRHKVSPIRSQIQKTLWQDPEYRSRQSEALKSQAQTKVSRQNRSKALKKLWQNPDHRHRMMEKWGNEASREKRSRATKETWKDTTYRRKFSEYMKRRWENPEYRQGFTGENHPNWQGGVSFEPYPPEFNGALKWQIRKRDSQSCAICGKRALCVHHINYKKDDNRFENLITLDRACHSKTNFNRRFWQIVLSPIAQKRTAEMIRMF